MQRQKNARKSDEKCPEIKIVENHQKVGKSSIKMVLKRQKMYQKLRKYVENWVKNGLKYLQKNR